jgi:ribosomal protein S18 acetylase RimI-like enzyme
MIDQTIRLAPCRLDDIGAVLELWDLAHIIPLAGDSVGALRLRLERDADLFLLAWSGDIVVGTLMGGWDGWRGGMYRLATHPGFRRRGIARMLVQAVEKALQTRAQLASPAWSFEVNQDLPNSGEVLATSPTRNIERYAKVLD